MGSLLFFSYFWHWDVFAPPAEGGSPFLAVWAIRIAAVASPCKLPHHSQGASAGMRNRI